MIKNYINHIVFVIDRSGSMYHLSEEVVKVFDSQVHYLAQRSKEMDQETRVSVYLFNGSVECLVYDKDVLRLPSLKSYYSPGGSTALIGGTLKAIQDLKQTPELYGDHSFLLYVLTDGQNTDNGHLAIKLESEIKGLADNWTVAVMVPDQFGVREAKQYGFPADNIRVWATSSDGLRDIGEVIKQTTNHYMQARSTGVRGTKSLFSLNTGQLTKNVVSKVLEQLNPYEYLLLPISKDSVIKPFVESWTKKDYRPGSAYYQLTKSEEIQSYKQICVQNKKDGRIYGGIHARTIIGLPATTVKVSPATHPEFNIYVQSTSLNRKLIAGTNLIVLK